MWQKPTPIEEFEAKTGLDIEKLVDEVLATYEVCPLVDNERVWFINDCSKWFRRFHANSFSWRKTLEVKTSNINPSDECRKWIRHWLRIYLGSPSEYRRRMVESC